MILATNYVNFSNTFQARFAVSTTNTLLHIVGGLNDIVFGSNAVATINTVSNWTFTAKALGCDAVVVHTLPSAINLSGINGGAMDAERIIYNQLLREQRWWDYLVDSANLLPPPPNITFFNSDQVHANDRGYREVARRLSLVLQKGPRNPDANAPADPPAISPIRGIATHRGWPHGLRLEGAGGLMLESDSAGSGDMFNLFIGGSTTYLAHHVGSGNAAASDYRFLFTSLGTHSMTNIFLAHPAFATNGFVNVATNANNVWQRAANSNAVVLTNIVGLIEKASASVVELNCNDSAHFTITNRISAATSVIVTNGANGQQLSFTLLGEAAGGTDRVVTVVPHLGQLAANLDIFGTALAANYSFTLTNGNAAQVDARIRRLNGTNVVTFTGRQFAF
jgi:hypothetical protein